jgi:hypothetical protein
MLEPFDTNLWTAEGPTVPFLGMPYPTRMALVRLSGGDLWVWSPIALTRELADEVERLGDVRHLVSPNKLHHLFLADWAERWPEARLHAPPGLPPRRRDLAFHSEIGDVPDPAWKDEIDQVVIRGSFVMDEVWFFHRSSLTAIVGDMVQKLDPTTLRPWHRFVMRLDGLVGPNGSTPREWRATFWNRRAAREAVRRALDWNPEHVVIAHGSNIRTEGTPILRRSLTWLRP